MLDVFMSVISFDFLGNSALMILFLEPSNGILEQARWLGRDRNSGLFFSWEELRYSLGSRNDVCHEISLYLFLKRLYLHISAYHL